MKKIKAVVFIYSFRVSRNWGNAGEGGDHKCTPSLMWLLHTTGWRMQNNYHPASKISTFYSPEHGIIPPLFGKGKLKLQVELKLTDSWLSNREIHSLSRRVQICHKSSSLSRRAGGDSSVCIVFIYLTSLRPWVQYLGLNTRNTRGKKKNLSMW